MKTKENKQGIMSGKISSLIMLSAALLVLNGCQKDELPTLTSTSEINQPALAKMRSNNAAAPFTIIVIDHAAARTQQADYRVEVQSDGNAVFTGRKNTALLGTHRIQLSSETMESLHNLFIKYDISQLTNPAMSYDLPTVTTSFRENAASEFTTRIDFNELKPNRLIDLREQAEKMMGISKFVIHRRGLKDSQATNLDHE